MTTHFDGSGGLPTLAARISSAFAIGRVAMRFVNQLESGTSSIVLMFRARVPLASWSGVTNRPRVSS